MAGGIVGLLDDVAALAKLAAASLDDVGAAASKAGAKAAGVVVDDTAVTPAYIEGVSAKRELPIIRRIATGSIRNKLLIIIPVALLLSEVAPLLVELILMAGGLYLSYEGAEKVWHHFHSGGHADKAPAVIRGKEAEDATVSSAVRTDFILSAEIMVITLKEVLDQGLATRAVILVLVAAVITAGVYGVVALIVKMDDVGLVLAQRDSETSQRIGRSLVTGMPKLLTVLTVVGTAAMLWVGGHILLVGTDELGWHGPYDFVHRLEEPFADMGGFFGGLLTWLVNTGASAVVGLAAGAVLVAIMSVLPFGSSHDDDHERAAAH